MRIHRTSSFSRFGKLPRIRPEKLISTVVGCCRGIAGKRIWDAFKYLALAGALDEGGIQLYCHTTPFLRKLNSAAFTEH